MVIKINDREYPLVFGFAAINYLDEKYYVEASGIKIGQGIGLAVNYLIDENPVAVKNVIKAGICTEISKPSNADLEKCITDIATDGNLDALCLELVEELKKQPLTAPKATKIAMAIYSTQME